MKLRPASGVAWSLGLLSIALLLGALAIVFVDRHAELPASVSDTSWSLSGLLNVAETLSVPVIGILLALKRPDNRLGWLFLIAGVAASLSVFGPLYGAHALVVSPGSLPAGRLLAWIGTWVGLIALGLLAFLFLLFPTGTLRSARWRPAAWFVAVTFALLTTLTLITSAQSWTDPYGPSATRSGGLAAFLLFVVPVVASLAVSVAALVVRFRGSTGDERLQLKWFVVAALIAVVVFTAGFGYPSSNVPPALSVLQSLAFMFLWASIAIAVLKYRLYEIDVVINKAVVYGVLAAFFTVVYLGVVVGIGTAVGSAHNAVLTVIAAGVIALAFNPVRTRATRLANRIAYGKRATPYEVLSELAQNMAGTYSLEDVLPRTARMLAEGTGATRADVWLLSGSELVDEATWPASPTLGRVPATDGDDVDVPGASRTVPVRHQGDLLGAISIHKSQGDPVSATESKLLSDLASQAGLVLRNVRLIEDLKASRQRIVAAQDQERRKIERNIHDGAQQQLVALAIKLNLAKSWVKRDADQAEQVIEQVRSEAQDALENLRDLARGIYPPLLADQGLAAALEAQARKSIVPTTIESDGIGRYPQEAEAAVYFCALEALQKVAKYANASHASVRLSALNGHLSFAVQDDGIGFDTAAHGYGTGLQGMADRLAALGGELRVSSALGGGTLVEGSIPAERLTSPSPGSSSA